MRSEKNSSIALCRKLFSSFSNGDNSFLFERTKTIKVGTCYFRREENHFQCSFVIWLLLFFDSKRIDFIYFFWIFLRTKSRLGQSALQIIGKQSVTIGSLF